MPYLLITISIRGRVQKITRPYSKFKVNIILLIVFAFILSILSLNSLGRSNGLTHMKIQALTKYALSTLINLKLHRPLNSIVIHGSFTEELNFLKIHTFSIVLVINIPTEYYNHSN